MFVYQDKEQRICVSFDGNLPTEDPKYIIVIDKENEQLYTIKGEIPLVTTEDDTQGDDTTGDDTQETDGETPIDETEE